jgi:glycosyltransferase involved in cell wall biosynthesis
MLPEGPLISVIVAVFNGAKTLQRCIDSVANQTYSNIELVIIDGGSSDGSVEILQNNTDKITYWESKPDRGIYHAWNKALDYVHGEWICFLGSDDYFWDSNVIKNIVEYIDRNPTECRVLYGRARFVDDNGIALKDVGEPWEDIKDLFRECMSFHHGGTLHHRTLFQKHGIFDESFRIAGDYDFLLRELKSGDAQFIPDLILVAFQVGGISSDPQNKMICFKENARARRKNRVFIITQPFLRYYLRNILVILFGESFVKKLANMRRSLVKIYIK